MEWGCWCFVRVVVLVVGFFVLVGGLENVGRGLGGFVFGWL